jgi:hypothetical protein
MQGTAFSTPGRVWTLTVSVLALLVAATTASANPMNIPAGAKKVYSFNVIGHPNGYTGNCGEGHRIFVPRDAHNVQVTVTSSTRWEVIDCGANGKATLGTNDVGLSGHLDVYVRILGKPGGQLHVCGNQVIDPVTGEILCLAGTIDLTREKGQSKFQIAPSSLFDASLEDVLWTVQTNSDFRIAQFRVYTRP